MDVFNIYSELRALYNAMLSLSGRQNDVLQTLYEDAAGEEEKEDNVNSYSRLNEFFAQRDHLEKTIDGHNERLRQINIAPELLKKINDEKAEISKAIIKIQNVDKKNQQLLTDVKNELEKKLGRIKKNQQANTAYSPNFDNEPWFLDSKK
ncbi:MAG: hypothetical protein LBR98_07985 [Syntrophomonadaceae bacterium]|nr:hypothetical protein [Syntrophomonadaceae bacterium]